MWKIVPVFLLVAAGAAAQTSLHGGLTDSDEFKDRQDCLYRDVARMIKTEGASNTALDEIATAAAQICGKAVRERLQRESRSSHHGESLLRYDRLQTELRALAIGRELREANPHN